MAPLLRAAALTAPPSALLLLLQPAAVHSLQIHKPSPPRQPHPSETNNAAPKAMMAPTPPPVRGNTKRARPLRAYTVADNRRTPPPSLSSFVMQDVFESFGDMIASQFHQPEDSLFSFEGGGLKAAVKPIFPNLEVEASVVTTDTKDVDAKKEREELLSELDVLTTTFNDLRSSMDYKSALHAETIKVYESKVQNLEEANILLQEGMNTLTIALEKQGALLEELQRAKDADAAREEENEVLRRRLRHLEGELSDMAFESRRAAVPAPPPRPPTLTSIDAEKLSVEATREVAMVAAAADAEITPKAPSAPVPSHVKRIKELESQVKRYQQEEKSARKLFGKGMRRGLTKVGRALNLWNPAYNLSLWGKLRAA